MSVVFCFVVLGCVLCLCCFEWLPTLSRCRSFLPDLMTVRAVMVRAALEKKPLVLKGSRPCGGVRRARMQRELFSQQHGLQ